MIIIMTVIIVDLPLSSPPQTPSPSLSLLFAAVIHIIVYTWRKMRDNRKIDNCAIKTKGNGKWCCERWKESEGDRNRPWTKLQNHSEFLCTHDVYWCGWKLSCRYQWLIIIVIIIFHILPVFQILIWMSIAYLLLLTGLSIPFLVSFWIIC